jgi:type IV secretory pathway VirB3-like protein
MVKMEFSKKLLIADYIVLLCLFALAIKFDTVDFSSIIIAWIAQIGISSAAYYWKAKTENRVKVPIKVIESLPSKMLNKIDLTQVITAIIQSE